MDGSKLATYATRQAEAGHFRKAVELFTKASEKDPKNAKHHEARAQCLMELEDFSEALSAAEAAVQLDASWLPAKATLGRAQLNAGQLQDAVISLEEAVCLASHQDEAWCNDLKQELQDAKDLLERHWKEHHDVVLPTRSGHLRIRQALDCRYCNIIEGELGPGGALWAAGASLATLVSREEALLGGGMSKPSILELGSGTGAAGLAFAATGAKVLLTDRQSVLPLLRLNVDLNKDLLSLVGGSADIGEFDWLSPPEEILRQHFDLVIGADLVYSFAAVDPFMAAITALLQEERDGRRVSGQMLYAHFPRFPKLDEAMHTALSSRGFETQAIATPEVTGLGTIPEEALSRVQLLQIRRRSGMPAMEPWAPSPFDFWLTPKISKIGKRKVQADGYTEAN